MKLNNGKEMPQLGLGTFLLIPEDAENSTREALKMGYRLIDTANAYRNERAVGRGIKESGVDRKDIFVSTKLWPTEYENPNAVDETLERLGLDYIDLLFLHQPAGNYMAGYKQLEKAYKEGKIKAIGLSNFEDHMDEILSACEIKPQVVQVECHPYFPQTELRKITDKENIRLMSWYPLGGKGNASILHDPVITSLAGKYHKSSAQIILKWHIQMGFIVIPGSRNIDHIRENKMLDDFTLSEKDMALIATLSDKGRIYIPSQEALNRFAQFKPQYETK